MRNFVSVWCQLVIKFSFRFNLLFHVNHLKSSAIAFILLFSKLSVMFDFTLSISWKDIVHVA